MISEKYNVPFDHIIHTDNISNQNMLYVGEELIIR